MVPKRLWLRWNLWRVRMLEIIWILQKVKIIKNKFKFNINQTKNQTRNRIIREIKERIIIISKRTINIKIKVWRIIKGKIKEISFFWRTNFKKIRHDETYILTIFDY